MKINLILLAALIGSATLSARAQKPHPAVAPAIREIDKVVAAGPFQPNWSSLEGYQIPQWYKDAKFGIFIHWGAYSVPAYGSEWYPRMMYIPGDRRGKDMFQHHVETFGTQNKFGYKDFIPMFRAEKFDAAEWVKLFQEAGAKYIVPVAEHHDGFPMYACAFTEWDASEMGPKRDIIAELEKEARANGLKFGISSHRAFNWMFYIRKPEYDNADPKYAGLYGRPMPFLFDKRAPAYQTFFPPHDQQFMDDWLARTCELVNRFNPDLIWFDFGISPSQERPYNENWFQAHLQRFASYYYNHRLKDGDDIGVINYKWKAFPEKAAVLDLERSKMDKIREPFWQTDTAVSSSSWGYTVDQKYKTPDRLVDDLIDIVSKNGCLLLNVGPRADGTIPDEDQAILRAIGRWLKVNGEAIYGTTHWSVYGEGPTGTATGHLSEQKNKPFTAEDIRFTTKDGSLYATLLDWPSDNVATIKTLAEGSERWKDDIQSVKLLGATEPLTWERTKAGLVIRLPKQKPCDFAYVLKIR